VKKIYEIFLTDILKNKLITQAQYSNIEAALRENKPPAWAVLHPV